MAFNSKRSPIKGRLNQLSREPCTHNQGFAKDYVRLRRVLSSLFALQFAEKLREEICCQKQRLPNRGPGDTRSQRIVWGNPGLRHSQDCQNVFCVCVRLCAISIQKLKFQVITSWRGAIEEVGTCNMCTVPGILTSWQGTPKAFCALLDIGLCFMLIGVKRRIGDVTSS